MRRRGALRALGAWIVAATGLQGCGGGGGFSIASIGSGGTGISPGGIGSGGTGVQVTSTGPVDGFGSIVVNGVRFETDEAQFRLADVSALKLGMTAQVYGVVGADGTPRATLVTSAADLRGPAGAVNAAAGTFTVYALAVRAQPETVFAGGLSTLADLRNGDPVQVHGLPDGGGMLLATRVEKLPAPGTPVLVGTLQALDTALQSFVLAGSRVRYAGAAIDGSWTSSLAPGMPVRVRATANADGTLQAQSVEPWSTATAATTEESALALAGLVSDFASLASFRVDGVRIDASGAKVSGGPSSRVAQGARVEVSGTLRVGILVAERVRLREAQPAVATTAEEVVYSARGSVGSYRSPSSFKVQGQDVDAANAVYVGGTAADLGSGRKVLVTGTRVVDDVLVASRVEFL